MKIIKQIQENYIKMPNSNIPKNPTSYRDNYVTNSEFKLSINYDIYNEKVHVLVEGKDDEALLCNIMNDNIDVIVCSGKKRCFKEVRRLLRN